MGKSTHPFVQRMNEAKSVHRAMRAGDERVAPKPAPVKPTPSAQPTAKRTLALVKKAATPAPTKGVLTAILPPDAA